MDHQEILLNKGCDVLNGLPFWVLFVTVIVLAHTTPLVLFYLRNDPPDEEYTLKAGNKWFTIPAISHTWRVNGALWGVGLCLVINLIVYSICLEEAGNIICLNLGLLLGAFVFCFNTENGAIAKVHAFFAFGFFVYIIWCVFALRIYANYEAWYWPYIVMGPCFLGMLGFSIYDACKKPEKRCKHWPWPVCLAEHLFVFSFEIYLITIT